MLSTSLGRLGLTVTGLDPNEAGVTIARENVFEDPDLRTRVKFEQGTIEEKEGQFDIITCMEVIEHVDNQAEFVNSLAK